MVVVITAGKKAYRQRDSESCTSKGRDSSILTCIHTIAPGDISSFEDVSVKNSLDFNLQQHRAVQTLLKCFLKPSSPDSKVWRV
jgi:hypothetical protein